MIGIDLFAGAGGMSLGAALAGLTVELAIERDVAASMTYSSNHPNTEVIQGDITEINLRHLKRFRSKDVVIFGGPPCQGFSWSNARTRSVRNGDNWLWKEFVRIVRLVDPQWVIFENVQGIVDTAGGTFVDGLASDLTSAGFTISFTKLNAMNYGVPQNRTRFFLVANKINSQFEFPLPTTELITVDQAIRDLPSLCNGHSESWMPYGRKTPSGYAQSLRGDLLGCENHLVTRNSSLVLKRYQHVPQGGNWQNIPSRLMKNYADRARCHTGIYHRLNSKSPSIVIGNFRKNMLIHPTQQRGLSVREAARIQSFPDSYLFCGSIGFQQQQVGNAVPPLLARSVFAQILKNT